MTLGDVVDPALERADITLEGQEDHVDAGVRSPGDGARGGVVRRERLLDLRGVAAIAIAALGFGSGCARSVMHPLVDAVMATAHRPARVDPGSGGLSEVMGTRSRYQLLAGDLHCHVSPPDGPGHVSRGVAETVALAREEGLDFVVLTPHVRGRFFLSEEGRARALSGLKRLEEEVAREGAGGVIFVTGFEYTDFTYGHVGAGFADLGEVLSAVSVEEAAERPGRFFEEYVRRGGVLVINHPILLPLNSILPMAWRDMSWRPLTGPGPYPEEVRAADRLAQGVEVFNLAVMELRDRFLLFDAHYSVREMLARLDREVVARGRRMAPVGGSDSHSGHLRATTFVLSEGRTREGIRDALVGGRVCVRDPAGCSFEVRAAGGASWVPVGSSIQGVEMVHARARGEVMRVFVNGQEVARETAGREVPLPVERGRCSVIRARVDEGYSGAVYVNCPF